MSEEHFDFSALDERSHVGIGLADIASNVSGRFMGARSGDWTLVKEPSQEIEDFVQSVKPLSSNSRS